MVEKRRRYYNMEKPKKDGSVMNQPKTLLRNSIISLQNRDSFFNGNFIAKEAAPVLIQNQVISSFPIDIYPEPIQRIIIALNTGLQFPVDYISASMIFAVSVAIGNSFKVEVKRGWQESSVIYLALVGRPGTNKTHPLKFALKPLLDQDETSYQSYLNQKLEYDNFKRSKNKDILPTEDSPPVKPTLKKYIISDVTPEALANVHENNKRGIGVYVDELAGWFKNFNKYNSGSEQEFWCSNWSGSPIIIDRKTSEPSYIKQPFISVCGTIQPGILNEMAKDNRGLNGFIDRILFAMPEGTRKEQWTEQEIDPQHITNWYTIINRLIETPAATDATAPDNQKILRFNAQAFASLSQWQKTNTFKCNETENEVLSGIYTKLEIYCIRFCLINQLLHSACSNETTEEITEVAVQGAIKLIEYFRESATSAYMILYESSPVDQLTSDKKKLYEALQAFVKTADVITKARDFGISERTARRMLSERELFRRLQHGLYEKLL